MQGKLIVIEGLDGSGKSTQLALLREKIEQAGLQTKQIKLPDYDSDSCALVKMYLAGDFGKEPGDVNAYVATSFYAADRFANYKTKWKADYENGTLILADRYTTSNAYHQSLKLPRDQWGEYLAWLEDFEYNKMALPKPDLVIYLDMPIDVSQKLMTGRYHGEESKKDIHEANVAYLKQCAVAAAYAAEKMGWHVIHCAKDGEPLPIEQIHENIYAIVKEALAIG